MTCEGCGNKEAYHVVSRYDRATGLFDSICDRCGGSERGEMPVHSDVYWPGHPHYNRNICDKMGRPIFLESREHKARIMKEQGIREAGDSIRGARTVL